MRQQNTQRHAITSVRFAFKLVDITNVWSPANMILGVPNAGRYGSMLYHGAIVSLFDGLQHARFHCTVQPCSVHIRVHTKTLDCIFV